MPSEQDEAFRRIWQHLRQIEQVADGRHDTEEWRSHGGYFVMCCVRIPPESLSPAIDDLRESLRAFPYVRLHPTGFLHINVQELGFLTGAPAYRGDITQDWLDEFIQHANQPVTEFSPFDVTLGGANSFSDAAFLDVHDNGWLSRIQARLVDFVKVPPRTRFAYLPVATVAHYTHIAPVGSLVAALTPYRDTAFARFRVTALDIVKVRTGEGYSDLEVVHSFQLGEPRGLIDLVQGPKAS